MTQSPNDTSKSSANPNATEDLCPLMRSLAVEDVPEEEPYEMKITATEVERSKIAKILELTSLTSLSALVKIKSKARGRLSMVGRMKAHYTQNCVVTLEPIETTLDEAIEAEFWPQHQIEEYLLSMNEGDALDLEEISEEGPDPIVDESVDIGQILFENISTAIDPFPRKEGAVLELEQQHKDGHAEEMEEPKNNPFAILKTLQNDNPDD